MFQVPDAEQIMYAGSDQVQLPIKEHPDDPQDSDRAQNPLKEAQVLLLTDEGISTVSVDLSLHQASSIFQSLGRALELARAKAEELQLEQVALDIEHWVKRHPYKAAFYTASALSIFAPEILSIPALEALGFGAMGVRAGMSTRSVSSFHIAKCAD